MANHCPSVRPTDGHFRDSTCFIAFRAVFIRPAGDIEDRIISCINIGLKHILRKVIIRRADIGIVELVRNPNQRRRIIVPVIIVVHNDFDMEFVRKVEHFFLFIANDKRDIADSGSL